MKRKVLFKREIGFVVVLTVILLVIALLWRLERPRVGIWRWLKGVYSCKDFFAVRGIAAC